MPQLPHAVERLGPDLRSWVERQLLEDLKHYGIDRDDPSFDWSRVVQEGHRTDIGGRMLESLSDIWIHDRAGTPIADGWMDFALTSADQHSTPILFWLFLSLHAGGTHTKVKTDACLPSHLWERLSDSDRTYIASADSMWLQGDPKVLEWKRKDRLTRP